MLMGLVSLQSIIDLVVAGISLMIGLGIFSFIASVLCFAAFFQHAKDVSLLITLAGGVVMQSVGHSNSLFAWLVRLSVYLGIWAYELSTINNRLVIIGANWVRELMVPNSYQGVNKGKESSKLSLSGKIRQAASELDTSVGKVIWNKLFEIESDMWSLNSVERFFCFRDVFIFTHFWTLPEKRATEQSVTQRFQTAFMYTSFRPDNLHSPSLLLFPGVYHAPDPIRIRDKSQGTVKPENPWLRVQSNVCNPLP
ncbi:LOW QUALITY PROTEIN: hypothetical protein Cgig2_007853 [Carnegiea gigantea]|uniref:Uncharacterized protein n=1 Tax=Carnegiea gigantea TaxID=171969 RepID=A0A9Q1JNB7_9CARY|nr:LOW QUALITY PROTEIN: hypothetical protein Cgig2_007853 [Carnegiea gigantea]